MSEAVVQATLLLTYFFRAAPCDFGQIEEPLIR
jgi:hypothetical protein